MGKDKELEKQSKSTEKTPKASENISNNDLLSFMKEMDKKLTSKIDESEKRMITSINSIRDEVEQIRSDMKVVEESLEFQSGRINKLEGLVMSDSEKTELLHRIEFLEKQLRYQEGRSRKYNLLIYGIPENPNEDCEKTILKFFVENLKLQSSSVENIIISNVHRVPRLNKEYKPGMPNPIVVKFARMKDRNTVYFARVNLKDSKMSIRTDLPNDLKVKRGKLARISYRLRRDEHLQTAMRESKNDVWIETRAGKNQPWKMYSLTSADEQYLVKISSPAK